MEVNARQALEGRLASLFGYDDGASDILDHLISIESSAELFDYLSQLLGNDGEEVQAFVENVGQYQRGEQLSSNDGKADDATPSAKTERTYEKPTKKQAPAKQEKKKPATKVSKLKTKQPSTANTAQSRAGDSKKQNTEQQRSAPDGAMKIHPQHETTPVEKQEPDTAMSTTARPEEEKESPPPNPVPPKRGKAKVVCGCFGTKHDPLTNCLYCGRISCAREGYSFCPFCGFMVDKPTDIQSMDKASQHRDRLLRYDRDFARRTVVIDDQADYYGDSSATNWLTEDEKELAEQKRRDDEEQQRRDARQVKLNFAV